MNSFKSSLLFIFLTIPAALFCTGEPQCKLTPLDASSVRVDCTIPLLDDEYLYTDQIDISIDNPALSIEDITLPTSSAHFDEHYKTTKQIAQGAPLISVIIKNSVNKPIDKAYLRMVYYTNKNKTARESLFPISIGQKAEAEAIEQNQDEQAPTIAEKAEQQTIQESTTAATPQASTKTSWSEYISRQVKTSHRMWLQLLLVLLLGLLLSLTPCIYPMIPITIGILQAQGSKSIGQNFLLALSYTLGIATTFALLGLAASFAGVIFGSFLSHPVVIGCIIALLLYIAFSLFGFYELYIPRSLANNHVTPSKTSSLLTAFLFGAVSGTVASPCLSPGIIFMLTLVASMNNLLLGFLLLFFFGIGLGLPLLIIGTFSGSLALLPRAGMWMNEIKYLFGFMMIGMAIYFLSALVSYYIILFLLGILILIAGIFYLIHTNKMQTKIGKLFYTALSIALIAASIVIMSYSIKERLATQHHGVWRHDLVAGQAEALKQGKPLFVFVHAPLCVACQEVEHQLESSVGFMTAIKKNVAISLNLAEKNQAIREFAQKYEIMGAPSCLIINPQDGSVVKRSDGILSAEQLEELINALS